MTGRFRRTAGATLLGLLALCGACEQKEDVPPLPRRPEDPPAHIVLIVVDTLRADHTTVHGHHRNTTPFLKKFAREGVVFERAYAHSGWTLPSMASLLTGRLPFEHGAIRYVDGDGGRLGRLAPEQVTLAEHLRAEGYRTAAFVNNPMLKRQFGLDQGFDVYDYAEAGNAHHRSAAETFDVALEWLATGHDRERKAFVVIHLMEPHVRYAPPPETRYRFTGRGPAPVPMPFVPKDRLPDLRHETLPADQQDYVRRLYDEEVLYVDQTLRGFVERMRDHVGLENSWIAFTSDHGEEFWDHGGFEHGHTLLGELVRVPLILWPPEEADVPAQRIGSPVQHLDLFHTLAVAGGADLGDEVSGVDLLEVARGTVRLQEDRAVLNEDVLHGDQAAALTRGRYRLVVNLEEGSSRLWRIGPHGQGGEASPTVDDPLRRELSDQLATLRGDLEAPTEEGESSRVGEEGLDALRSLGYVQ